MLPQDIRSPDMIQPAARRFEVAAVNRILNYFENKNEAMLRVIRCGHLSSPG
jgi:hypothetical protein